MDYIGKWTENYSASDLKGLCQETALYPIRELGTNILNVRADQIRAITIKDFKESIKTVKPSTNLKFIEEIESWNEKYGS